MKRKNLFIIIFIISLILVGPFILKKVVMNNDEKAIQTNVIGKVENNFNNSVIEENFKINENIAKKEETLNVNDGKSETVNKQEVNNESDTNTKNDKLEVQEEKKEDNQQKEKDNVGKTYFDDALFIGDSRTVGISEYGNLDNATFFANTGMSVYNIYEKNVSVPKVGKIKLNQLLTSKQFGKIYIMLGINELGYNMRNTIKKYNELIEYIQNKQTNAIIYIEANLHVTAEKSKKDSIINNVNINKFNNEISKLADNKKIFYIDINKKFDDKNGNLPSNYSQDNVHIYAKYYKEWSDWLSKNAVK